MTGLIRLTFGENIPYTPVAADGQTIDAFLKSQGIDMGIGAMVGILVGTAGTVDYQPLRSDAGQCTITTENDGTTVQLRCKRILSTSGASGISILIGDV
jgi:FtsP/CotA-like multicopper oxidase with cupredoxin domain